MRARCYINSVFRRHWCLNNIRPQPQNLARIGLRRLLWAFLASAPEPSQNRPQEAPFEPFWPQPQNLARIGLRRLLLSLSGLSPGEMNIWRCAWRTWSSQFFHWTTFRLEGYCLGLESKFDAMHGELEVRNFFTGLHLVYKAERRQIRCPVAQHVSIFPDLKLPTSNCK